MRSITLPNPRPDTSRPSRRLGGLFLGASHRLLEEWALPKTRPRNLSPLSVSSLTFRGPLSADRLPQAKGDSSAHKPSAGCRHSEARRAASHFSSAHDSGCGEGRTFRGSRGTGYARCSTWPHHETSASRRIKASGRACRTGRKGLGGGLFRNLESDGAKNHDEGYRDDSAVGTCNLPSSDKTNPSCSLRL
jgi:hypothetical protein